MRQYGCPRSRLLGDVRIPNFFRTNRWLIANSVKSVLIFFAPIALPRLISAYRSFRTPKPNRPGARPLPVGAGRSLNLLFGSIALFLILSLPFNPHAPEPNIFTLTRSRINTPTDVLFTRLGRIRSGNELTEADTLLRGKFTSLGARKVYLTFGPDALTSCQYCSFENLNTYLLYYLPFHVLLPHLVHLGILGMATSATFGGREVARWRTKIIAGALLLTTLDILIVSNYDPVQGASAAVRAGQEPPSGLYNAITLLRPLAFTVFDAACSLLIYLAATNRFFYKPPSPAEQINEAVSTALESLTGSNARLHAAGVVRNAMVRDKGLKARDDLYWQTMDRLENSRSSEGRQTGDRVVINNIWEEEEVARAVSRAMAGQGGVDLAQLGTNANEFVRGVTDGLE